MSLEISALRINAPISEYPEKVQIDVAGCMLGEVIPAQELLVKHYIRMKEETWQAWSQAIAVLEQEMSRPDFMQKSEVEQNTIVQIHRSQIDQLQKRCQCIQAQLEAYRESPSLENLSETIFEWENSAVEFSEHSYPAERFIQTAFTDPHENVLEKLKAAYPVKLFSSSVISEMARKIQMMLQESSRRVIFCASQISLGKKRILPLVLKTNSPITERLEKSAAYYYAVSAIELGGAFMGICREGESDMSIHSLGAILSTPTTLEKAYQIWKENLQQKGSGYSIACQVERLDKVMASAEILLPMRR